MSGMAAAELRAKRRAAALITAAASADRSAFGRAYGAILEPELDTDSVLLLRSFLRAAYQDFAAADDDPYERAHQMVAAAYPTCSELLEVNLAVLEHVLRSALGLSDYLASIDGYHAALYLAALAGGIRHVADESGHLLRTATAVLAIQDEASP
jgi:hypothetical protein